MNKTILFKKFLAVFLIAAFTSFFGCNENKNKPTNFVLNDIGVFKKHGVDLMIYNDSYNTGGFFDEKVNGIQMIHHDVRTVTGGAVRLSPTPEQWDLTPIVEERIINESDNSVLITLYYSEFDFRSKLKIESKGDGCLFTVILDQPVPKALEGKAGMNIEFLPSTYFTKTFLMDEKTGICPLVPTGPMVADPFSEKIPQFNGLLTNERFGDTYAKALPFAEGKKLVLSPDDPKTLVAVESLTGEIGLYDGRNVASNGWLVVRELLPAGKTGEVVQWMFTPNSVSGWIREPVISHSQVGYHPNQDKVAVIELDANDKALGSASLVKVNSDGKEVNVLSGKTENWGKFLRYNYLKFDFTSVKEQGIYKIKYGNFSTGPFPIANEVYSNTWHPTLDILFPVQMDHMSVKQAYRMWHGNPHKDDALQAPTDTLIHDGYRMGSTTGTKYKPYEHIPGLNIGGWFDAGDFDIQTGTHCTTIGFMVGIWEDLKIMRDQTYIDQVNQHVVIHHPDGVPDLLQQIEHGTLALIAQYRAFGHAIRGIVQPNLWQYNSIGDAVNLTDGLIYNPKLKPHQKEGIYSGTKDDRWAFTTQSPGQDINLAGALAASSRALKSYNDELAAECLAAAEQIWLKEVLNAPVEVQPQPQPGAPGGGMGRVVTATQKAGLTIELLVATGDSKYADFLTGIWPTVKTTLSTPTRGFGGGGLPSLLKAIPFMGEDFKNDLREHAYTVKNQLDSISTTNPYGIPLGRGGFYGAGGNFAIVSWALTNAKLHQHFPDIISKEYATRGLNYVLGCHPASNISFVSGVGAHSKRVTYGNNRADFTFIPGAMVPGNYLISPDFYENKEDWPFIWYQNEYVVDGCAGYIYLAALVDKLYQE
jgi:endoglucanase